MYEIVLEQSVVKKDVPDLPKKIKQLVQKAIHERLEIDPVMYGKPLRYSLKGYRRIRISDYRIIYRVDEKAKTVYIVAIKHRKNVYE